MEQPGSSVDVESSRVYFRRRIAIISTQRSTVLSICLLYSTSTILRCEALICEKFPYLKYYGALSTDKGFAKSVSLSLRTLHHHHHYHLFAIKT